MRRKWMERGEGSGGREEERRRLRLSRIPHGTLEGELSLVEGPAMGKGATPQANLVGGENLIEAAGRDEDEEGGEDEYASVWSATSLC